MLRVDFATKVRGFFKHLFSAQGIDAVFSYSPENIYEAYSRWGLIKSAMAKCRLLDFLGIIEIIKPQNKDCDIYGSFNRFLKGDKPYFIYVENPTALYHYRLERNRTQLGKRKIDACMRNPNLKALVFMSQACAQTFERVCHPIPTGCIATTIYPYVPNNKHVNEMVIQERCKKEIRLLYIAQGIRFFSKGGKEVVEAYKRAKILHGTDIHLTVVTNLATLNSQYLAELQRLSIETLDFTMNHEQMQHLYAQSTILLHPSSDDSFGLTLLEAMKAGLPIITTRLYALKEMVEEGENGFLTDPHYWFFYPNNRPNPNIWNHRKKTIYAQTLSTKLADFIYDKINILYNDRAFLERLSLNSYKKASSAPFSEAYIISQWNDIFKRMKC